MDFTRSHAPVHVQVLKMVSNLILSYSGPKVFILTVPASAFQDLGSAARAPGSED